MIKERFILESQINLCLLPPEGRAEETALFTMEQARAVRAFHGGIPGYAPTPLYSLSSLAGRLGLGSLCVKDESPRFGLNAFKSLGGSYCIALYLAEEFGISPAELTYDRIRSLASSGALEGRAVVTATDGNHGRGVAWAANSMGLACHVFMPRGSAQERLENIRKQGAQAEILDCNYDDAVRHAAKTAKENGWALMQDTELPGSRKHLLRLMQGYTTMAAELMEQWEGPAPTHVFLQAGVGSMAGAMAACLSDLWREEKPLITVVESNQADCLYRTALHDDGRLYTVGGDLNTIMAGLACGEPCLTAWKLLRAHAGAYLSISDQVTIRGMRALAHPIGGDAAIVSGESGAATAGTVISLMEEDRFASIRNALGLGGNSRVLVLSTEGATDRANYEKIVNAG